MTVVIVTLVRVTVVIFLKVVIETVATVAVSVTLGLSSVSYWPKLFKIRIEIWAFSFQICFQNQLLTSGSGQTENYTNTRICVIFRLTTSWSGKLISKGDLKWECSYFYSLKIWALILKERCAKKVLYCLNMHQ